MIMLLPLTISEFELLRLTEILDDTTQKDWNPWGESGCQIFTRIKDRPQCGYLGRKYTGLGKGMTRSIRLTGSTGAFPLILYVESPAKVPHRMDLVTPGPQPEMRQPRMPQGGESLMDLKIPLFTRKDEKDTDFKEKAQRWSPPLHTSEKVWVTSPRGLVLKDYPTHK